jgi:hypothetical protein
MFLMTDGRCRKHRLMLAAFCLVLSFALGCSRQHSDSTGSVVEQTLPFPANSQAFDGDSVTPAVPPQARVANATPFHGSMPPAVLPAGTLLTVQLPDLLSTDNLRPGDAFFAAVAAPFTIAGKTLVERGTPVVGRVESVKLADTNELAPRGYFQLTLNSIDVGWRTVAIRTLSLYTRATVQPSKLSSHPASAGIQKGRRLTFRLTAPVTLDNSTPVSNPSPVASAPASGRPGE